MAFLLYRNPKSHSQQQEQHKNNIEPFIMALMDVCRRLQVNIGGIKRERETNKNTWKNSEETHQYEYVAHIIYNTHTPIQIHSAKKTTSFLTWVTK